MSKTIGDGRGKAIEMRIKRIKNYREREKGKKKERADEWEKEGWLERNRETKIKRRGNERNGKSH